MSRPRRACAVDKPIEIDLVDTDDEVERRVPSKRSRQPESRSEKTEVRNSSRALRTKSIVKYTKDEEEEKYEEEEEGEEEHQQQEQQEEEEHEQEHEQDEQEDDEKEEFEEEVKSKKPVSVPPKNATAKSSRSKMEENPLNRFGFSVLSEKEKQQAKEASGRQSSVSSKAGRSSSRVAEKVSEPSPDRKSTARRTSSRTKQESSRRSVRLEEPEESRESAEEEEDDSYEANEGYDDVAVRKSSRSRAVAGYVEADSDDDFARSALIDRERGRAPKKGGKPDRFAKRKKEEPKVSDSDEEAGALIERDCKSTGISIASGDEGEEPARKQTRAGGDHNDSESEEEEEEGDDDDVEYKIQHVLARQSLTPLQWQAVCGPMNTRDVTRGSVLQQPDSEFNDPSKRPLEKFLIKWLHSSYLHVSWETEMDLVDLVGTIGKTQIRKFRERQLEGPDLFEDLAEGEYFPPDQIAVSRILEIDDEDTDVLTIDWANAPLPTQADAASSSPNAVSLDKGEGDGWDGVDAISPYKSKRKGRGGRRAEPEAKPSSRKNLRLHGPTCWMVVKWEGLPYCEASFEDVDDLKGYFSVNSSGRKQTSSSSPSKAGDIPAPSGDKSEGEGEYTGIEYEQPLRDFYRREQRAPSKAHPQGQKRFNRSLNTKALSAEAPAAFHSDNGFRLRDYQWDGVRWILFNWSQKRNCILADEMGLGKTIQTAGFLQFLNEHQNVTGPFLIVAPLSTVVNWQREMITWTDMDAVLYQGSQEDREEIRKYEFRYVNRKNAKGYKMQVVITTPETCMVADRKSINGRSLSRELSAINWDVIVVDEAHKLKNYDSKLSCTLRNEYSYQNCLLLTGTPLQNNTDELWTLLNFVAREEFEDRGQFVEDFGDLKSAAQLEMLHKSLKPYVLRREKEHVEKSVPPKEEVIIDVELTVPQKQYYRAIYEQNTAFLYKGGAKDGPRLTNLAMELRKCCNHPYLVKGAEAEISKHFEGEGALEIMVKSSGKLMLLDKLLPKLKADGHRVLIFSQFRIMLNIIEDYVNLRAYSYERVDGAVTGKKRQSAIDRYQHPVDGSFIMLLSTRAGGVGINLTAADTVIIFDSDWNPQNDLQAQARAHRIGQTKPVKVYRLLTRKTYETMMFKAASIKLGLDYAVMHNMHGQGGGSAVEGISSDRVEHVSALGKKELENLLKHGAYDIFREEKEGQSAEESNKFCEADIDQILSRSAVVIHDGKKSGAMSASAASFSKASFVVSGGATNDVAIDDPDFWTKVVGLAGGVDGLEEGVARKRKCREVFTSYKEPGASKPNGKEVDTSSASGSDSDSHGDDNDEGEDETEGRKAKKTRVDGQGVADWSESNLTKILSAMLYVGYGNWPAVREESRLKYWPLGDIARGGRLVVLQLLHVASSNFTRHDGSVAYVMACAAARLDPSLTAPAPPAPRPLPAAGSTAAAFIAANAVADFDAHLVVSEDSAFLASHLRRHKACRLALTCLQKDPFSPGSPKLFTPLSKSKAPADGDIPENALFAQCVQEAGSYLSGGVSFPLRFSAVLDGVDELAPEFYWHQPLSQKATGAATAGTEGGEVPVDLFSAPHGLVKALRECGLAPPRMYCKVHHTLDKGMLLKQRVLARQKLQQIEDLFEARFTAFVAISAAQEARLATTSSSSSSGSSSCTASSISLEDSSSSVAPSTSLASGTMEEQGGGSESAPHPLSLRIQATELLSTWIESNVSKPFSILRSCAPVTVLPAQLVAVPVPPPVAPVTGYAANYATAIAAYNAGVVAAAAVSRTVDGVSAATAPHPSMSTTLLSVDTNSSGSCVLSVSSVRSIVTADGSPGALGASGQGLAPETVADWGVWSSRQDALAVMAAEEFGWPSGDRRTQGWEALFRQQSSPGDFTIRPHFHRTVLNGRVFLRRIKEVVAVFRVPREVPKPVVAPAAVVPKVKAKVAVKLNVLVLKAVQRWGYPRKLYDELSAVLALEVADSVEVKDGSTGAPVGGDGVGRGSYLLSWASLAAHCGLREERTEGDPEAPVSAGTVEDIVAAMVGVKGSSSVDAVGAVGVAEGTGEGEGGGEAVEEGLLAGLSLRAIEVCIEKSDILHKLRMTLACHTDSELLQCFKRNCKGAGPTSPVSRRDLSLPAWWNPSHDLCMLKLVCSLGMWQWKKIAEDSEVSSPPADFTAPAKLQGAEWVVVLTARVAEKRFGTLLTSTNCISLQPNRIVAVDPPDCFYVSKRTAQSLSFRPVISSSSSSSSLASTAAKAAVKAAVMVAVTAAASTSSSAKRTLSEASRDSDGSTVDSSIALDCEGDRAPAAIGTSLPRRATALKSPHTDRTATDKSPSRKQAYRRSTSVSSDFISPPDDSHLGVGFNRPCEAEAPPLSLRMTPDKPPAAVVDLTARRSPRIVLQERAATPTKAPPAAKTPLPAPAAESDSRKVDSAADKDGGIEDDEVTIIEVTDPSSSSGPSSSSSSSSSSSGSSSSAKPVIKEAKATPPSNPVPKARGRPKAAVPPKDSSSGSGSIMSFFGASKK